MTLRNWFFPQVLGAYRADLMRGMDAHTFGPAGLLTYAQALQLVYNLRTDRTAETVEAGSPWYAPALQWAAKNQIVLPLDGVFSPNAAIPRQIFALYLCRLADGSPRQDPAETLAAYEDADSVTRLCADAMVWAVENGVMTGIDSKLQPWSALTRAQAATMLLRYTEL